MWGLTGRRRLLLGTHSGTQGLGNTWWVPWHRAPVRGTAVLWAHTGGSLGLNRVLPSPAGVLSFCISERHPHTPGLAGGTWGGSSPGSVAADRLEVLQPRGPVTRCSGRQSAGRGRSS